MVSVIDTYRRSVTPGTLVLLAIIARKRLPIYYSSQFHSSELGCQNARALGVKRSTASVTQVVTYNRALRTPALRARDLLTPTLGPKCHLLTL